MSHFHSGALSSVLGCLAAPLASPSEMPGAPFIPKKGTLQKSEALQTLPTFTQGQKSPPGWERTARGCMVGGHSSLPQLIYMFTQWCTGVLHPPYSCQLSLGRTVELLCPWWGITLHLGFVSVAFPLLPVWLRIFPKVCFDLSCFLLCVFGPFFS